MNSIRILLSAAMVGLLATQSLAGKKACVDKICCPEQTVEPVKRSCWDIECKEVCIPRVQLPWAKKKCCEPQCGRVIVVRRLKKKEYECGVKTGCKWNIQDNCCPAPCDACCRSGQTATVSTKTAVAKEETSTETAQKPSSFWSRVFFRR